MLPLIANNYQMFKPWWYQLNGSSYYLINYLYLYNHINRSPQKSTGCAKRLLYSDFGIDAIWYFDQKVANPSINQTILHIYMAT